MVWVIVIGDQTRCPGMERSQQRWNRGLSDGSVQTRLWSTTSTWLPLLVYGDDDDKARVQDGNNGGDTEEEGRCSTVQIVAMGSSIASDQDKSTKPTSSALG